MPPSTEGGDPWKRSRYRPRTVHPLEQRQACWLKPPLKLKEVWAIRIPLRFSQRIRDLSRASLCVLLSVLPDIHLLALAEVELAHRDGFQEALF